MGGESPDARRRTDVARQVKFVSLLVLVVLVLIVLFQNWESYNFDILFWEPPIPVSAVLLVVFGVGALAGGWVAHLLRRRG